MLSTARFSPVLCVFGVVHSITFSLYLYYDLNIYTFFFSYLCSVYVMVFSFTTFFHKGHYAAADRFSRVRLCVTL